MSFGMGSDKTSADSTMNSTQSIWGGQSPFLEALYSAAQGLQGQQSGQVGATANAYAGKGMNALTTGISSMKDIATTGGPVGQYANPNNALAQQQLSQLSQNIGQNFQRDVLPALNSQAGVAGAMGQSRNALARGVAASDAQNQIAQAGTNLYAQQYGIGAQAAGAATQARLNAAGELPGMGQSLYNLGLSPFTAQWAPLTALAGILGGPQALTTASSQSTQRGKSTKFNFGFS